MSRESFSSAIRSCRRASILAVQQSSGLSVREFCRREGISPPTFYRWRRETERLPFAEVRIDNAAETPAPDVMPVSDRAIEVTLASGDTLRLSCDLVWFGRIVAMLRERPC